MRKILFATVAITACAGAGMALAAHASHHSLFVAADSNNDGVVTRQEFDAGRDAMFARLDADNDGQLSRADHRRHPREDRASWDHHRMHGRHGDANNDGAISRDEFLARPIAMFSRLDADGDGSISADERSHRGRHGEGLGHRERRHSDANGDHQISRTEFAARSASVFDRLDANDDNRVTREEAAQVHGRE